MSPTDTDFKALSESVRDLKAELKISRDERRKDIRGVQETLAEVKAQVEKTNGRVTGLERWRDRVIGGVFAVGVMYGIAHDWAGVLLNH